MSNEVTLFGSDTFAGVTALADLGAGLGQLQSLSGGTGGKPLLKIGRHDGVWSYGQQGIEVQPGSMWAVNPNTFQWGYICWGDASNILGERMVSSSLPLPNPNELTDTGFAWQHQLAVDFVCLDGEDKGKECLYKITSVGGKRALSDLAATIGVRASAGNAFVVPVLELGADNYRHAQYGVIWFPAFTIKRWLDMNGNPEKANGDTAKAEEPEVEAPRVKTAEAPRRRRRRVAA